MVFQDPGLKRIEEFVDFVMLSDTVLPALYLYLLQSLVSAFDTSILRSNRSDACTNAALIDLGNPVCI